MNRILLVEDDEARYTRFSTWLARYPMIRLVWVKDAGVAVGAIRRARRGDYAGILLDHDLDKRLRITDSRFLNGGSVVSALVQNRALRGVPVLVHSMNPRGAANMTERLRKDGFDVTPIRFHDLTQSEFEGWIEDALLEVVE